MRVYVILLMAVLASSHSWADPVLDSAKSTFREGVRGEQQRHQKVMDGLTNTLLKAYGDARKRVLQTGNTSAYDELSAEKEAFDLWWTSGGATNGTRWEPEAPFLKKQLLTRMKPLAAKGGGDGTVSFDQYPIGDQKPPVIDGKPCNNFIFAHAPSVVTYSVPPEMNHFSAICGSFMSKSVKFKVVVNKKTLYESPMLSTVEDGVIKVEIDLPDGRKTLDLVVDDCGDRNSDHSYWAQPTVMRLKK